MAMLPELKSDWTTALRSGDYIQGNHALEIINTDIRKNCCLGVLCSIMGLERTLIMCEPDGRKIVLFDGQVGNLSLSLLGKVGFDSDIQNILINMNDNMGCSFNIIADWIDKNILTKNENQS